MPFTFACRLDAETFDVVDDALDHLRAVHPDDDFDDVIVGSFTSQFDAQTALRRSEHER